MSATTNGSERARERERERESGHCLSHPSFFLVPSLTIKEATSPFPFPLSVSLAGFFAGQRKHLSPRSTISFCQLSLPIDQQTEICQWNQCFLFLPRSMNRWSRHPVMQLDDRWTTNELPSSTSIRHVDWTCWCRRTILVDPLHSVMNHFFEHFSFLLLGNTSLVRRAFLFPLLFASVMFARVFFVFVSYRRHWSNEDKSILLVLFFRRAGSETRKNEKKKKEKEKSSSSRWRC